MATTKENVRARVMEMVNTLPSYLEQKLDVLLEVDLIDFEKEEDNYILPKEILVALAEDIKFQYRKPYPKRGDKQRIEKMVKAIVLGYSYEKL